MPTPNLNLPTFSVSDTAKLDTLLNSITSALDTSLQAKLDAFPKNYLVNTDAVRTGLTGGALFEGLEFWTTDTRQRWMYTQGAWRRLAMQPFSQIYGITTIPGATEVTIPFPAGSFTVAPHLQLTAISGTGGTVATPHVGNAVSQITTTGFKVRIFSVAGTSVGGILHWTATQATPTSATS